MPDVALDDGTPMGQTKTSSRVHGRLVPMLALLFALALLPVSIGLAVLQHTRARESLDGTLSHEASEEALILRNYFARARSIMLIAANNPVFAEFYERPGKRIDKVRSDGRMMREIHDAIAYLGELYEGSIGEACFIHEGGPENARVVQGEYAPLDELSPDETGAPFFFPTFALDVGQVHQSVPYVSPDTGEWVISNATPIPTDDGSKPAILHFEVTVESFRREAAALVQDYNATDLDVQVVDAKSGAVIFDSRYEQQIGAPLGRPKDKTFASVVDSDSHRGLVDVEGGRSAYYHLPATATNVNEWYIVVTTRNPGSLLGNIGLGPVMLFIMALVFLVLGTMYFRSYQMDLEEAATTDALTGLGNRRKLLEDFDRLSASASIETPLLLALMDLDGFKAYNDSFGHPAGDALLVRLGHTLSTAMSGIGHAYRMGGDEFCVLLVISQAEVDTALDTARSALAASGVGFTITCSQGSVLVPEEAETSSEALRMADRRMYAHKNSGRQSARRQSTSVLLKMIDERHPDLGNHVGDVADLAEATARRMSLSPGEIEQVKLAAALHDVGKMAIPDGILNKAGPLDDSEWEFMRRHTLIGERVLGEAPALANVAKLVRSSHEHYDGNGYPDALAGEEIPLAARIVLVCDAFAAMTSERSYRSAMPESAAFSELRRCKGTQFDPTVVDAFIAAYTDPASSAEPPSRVDQTV